MWGTRAVEVLLEKRYSWSPEVPPCAEVERQLAYARPGYREVVEGWGQSQAQAAARLGVTQPRLNDLLRGRLDRFSLDALIALAERAGLVVEMRIGLAAV